MWVTNDGKKPFSYRWAGVDHTVEAGASDEIDEGAARNVFGFGVDDKRGVLMRHGILKHSSEYENVRGFFDDFSFTNERPSGKQRARNSAVTSPPADAGE